MFGGGGGGLNPRKMKQMMEQMGIDIEDIDAEEVVIRTPDNDLVFSDAEVQVMNAQGQQTYQIVGEPDTQARTTDDQEEAAEETDTDGIPDEDVELVATRTGVSRDAAREALEMTGGDLAAAVDRLE